MKSYSVKSNAKRFARGIAAKSEGYFEAAEPVEVSPGAREWFPSVKLTVESAEQFITDDISDVTVVILTDGRPWENPAIRAAMSEGDAGVYEVPAEDMSELADASGLKAAFDAVEPAGDDAFSGPLYLHQSCTPRPEHSDKP